MTRKEQVEKINKLLSSITNKTEYYCTDCVLEDNKLVLIKDCLKHKHKFCYKHCKECNNITTHYSTGKCCKCQSKKYGLGNPEIHQKTIQNQIKNGTFNMMDKNIQK